MGTGVFIASTKICGLPWYRIYVRGVHVGDAPSRGGALQVARNYLRKLAQEFNKGV